MTLLATATSEAVEESRATTQAISYIPYGEVFVEQQAGGWSSPYLFNAKELDSETGLYYYGARYLDPSDAMWLSVDSLWEKYVGMSPYQYCAGNPVIRIELNGNDWILAKGYQVIWYAGNYGDTKNILHTYKASSGYENDGEDYRYPEDQNEPCLGPTVEGQYKLEFDNVSVESKAKTNKEGLLLRADKGIESLKGLDNMSEDEQSYILHSWGEHRIRMKPIRLFIKTLRDCASFYFHDSKKGHTSGCHEVETQFFIDLKEYAEAGNKEIYVKVEYEKNSHLYGETDLQE